MAAVDEVAREVGVKPACEALGVPRASWYRRKAPPPRRKPRPRPPPARALSEEEQERVADVLHSPRFVDRAPAEVCATLLDECVYLCSERTMYRILAARGEVKERRNQLRHPRYVKPRLVARGPNQVWSWDITKLRGPVKRQLFYLYVMLDIFSRYVVGWTLSRRSSAVIATDLVRRTVTRHGIVPGQVVVHGDRGTELVAKDVVHLLEDLGVGQSLSRPRVSDDNPFSESQFKTLKYHPGFPDRFGGFEDAHGFVKPFFRWYNAEHRHSGIAYLTPEVVHRGGANDVLAARQAALDAAYLRNPARFVNGPPRVPTLPDAVWINPPTSADAPERMLPEFVEQVSQCR
jgi:putative transposase